MEKFSKVIIMLIVIDMGFKSDMVEGGRGINISKEKVVNQPQNFQGLPPIFPGFRNWNFPGQQKPGQPNNIPGFPGCPGIPSIPDFFGFPPPSPGDPLLLPLFPFLPYFKDDPPSYCICLVGCIPLPQYLFPPGQSPQATPVMSPPDQGPLAPTGQPLPTSPSPFQSPPAQTPPLLLPMSQTPAAKHPLISPAGQLPKVPTPPIQSLSAQAEALQSLSAQAEALTPPSPVP